MSPAIANLVIEKKIRIFPWDAEGECGVDICVGSHKVGEIIAEKKSGKIIRDKIARAFQGKKKGISPLCQYIRVALNEEREREKLRLLSDIGSRVR
ncbi:MAG: hypothetical protein COU47_04310 [Candidatus Niyogibacteria bacterium CG10_big_fil_rev_8_21_14_0_10_46_36]|uniref:Uncharacterized protein n=1 Tax=Candidatus Niyogibacteria bacterium CG10_big_fil_rev_8_21_14_0_10_46_36 TaxID=1974726 RepID=A0A2H0TCK2_9BACT|nr:MAG: hypothetical protein COU47_04310 [Candidatus Niyogibacteria bacterium CG10_big_fil_rev_8_21_14_0_10_46_36]